MTVLLILLAAANLWLFICSAREASGWAAANLVTVCVLVAMACV